jgi:Tfp pilus assembly protein PilF
MKWLSGIFFVLPCAAQIPQMSITDIENSLNRNLRGEGAACEQPTRGASTSVVGLPPHNLECSEQLFSAGTAKPHEPVLSGHSVSVEQLRHNPPKEARRAFERGVKFERSGDHRRATAEYEKAIMRDPEFADAHNQLGVEYAELGRSGDAGTELRRSLALDPGSWSAHYNLALVQFQTEDIVGAEKSARQALDLSRSNAKVHLFLGLLLVYRMEKSDGIQHLQYAARTMPIARRILEELPMN